ncbi:hypothetical protein E8E11_009806 [Didymella keratinophila]|nr:hypothetical protein E8E11_009806 [Didymella keratinophila]
MSHTTQSSSETAPRTQRLICVGAVYMDTILSVPQFPQEDTKLRATKVERRRGGNTANALEVFTQLLPRQGDRDESTYTSEQYLLTVLPEYLSEDSKAVMLSLPGISSELCLFRKDERLAASSYIIQSAQNQTRTIVSANPLDEMTLEEFKKGVAPLIDDPKIGKDDVWIHFEGRIPEVILPCVNWLRETYGYKEKIKISLECEKPDRVGLKDIVPLVDLVFYSKIWAEAHYEGECSLKDNAVPARTFLDTQLDITHPEAILVCTWGAGTCVAMRKGTNQEPIISEAPAWRPSRNYDATVTDTVGAGDTFTAGMVYGMFVQKGWNMDQRLNFANELAGRKVYQEGFKGLGEAMRNGDWRVLLGVK